MRLWSVPESMKPLHCAVYVAQCSESSWGTAPVARLRCSGHTQTAVCGITVIQPQPRSRRRQPLSGYRVHPRIPNRLRGGGGAFNHKVLGGSWRTRRTRKAVQIDADINWGCTVRGWRQSLFADLDQLSFYICFLYMWHLSHGLGCVGCHR